MMFPRIPAGVTLCLSSLLACGVLLLQHAEDYANKLEGTLYTWAEKAPALLRQTAAACGASSWQKQEKEALAAFPAVPYLAGDAPVPVGLDSEADAPVDGESSGLAQEGPVPGEEEMPVVSPSQGVADAVPSVPSASCLPEGEGDVPTVPGAIASGEGAVVPADAVAPADPFAPVAGEVAVAEEGKTAACGCMARATERISLWERGQTCLRLGMEKARSALEMMTEYRRNHPEGWMADAQETGNAASPSTPQEEPLPPPGKRYVQCRIMMVGDSLMEGLGPALHRAMLDRKGLEVVVTAKYSTGLCRPDFFDWPATMRHVVSSRKPDLVIFFIGANDGQPIKEGKTFVPTGGKAWRDAYARKMDEMVSIAREQGAGMIWVELPAVGGRYSKLLHENQIAQRDYCEQNGITSLQTDPIFSGVFGKFESYGEYKGRHVRLRTKDLTHLTAEGNKKLVDNLLPLIDEKLTEFYQKHPEKRLTDEQAAKWKRVQAFYTIKYEPPKRRRK